MKHVRALALGVPALGLAHAIGIGSLVSLMTFRMPVRQGMSAAEKGKKLIDTVAFYAFMPTASLLVGSLVHWFMP